MTLDSVRSEAARVAAHVDLRDVRLWGVEADLASVPDQDDSRLSYKLDADLQVQHSAEDGFLLVLGTYSLLMSSIQVRTDEGAAEAEASGDNEMEDVASINFRLNALFIIEHEPGEPFSESELTAFGQTTGQFALYPYARELIANLTGRMGIPPLHMGVMRLHLDSREG